MLSRRAAGALVALLVLVAGPIVLAQLYPPELRYVPRGAHNEGLEGQPRGGVGAVVLVSAVADVTPRETLTEWPQNLRLRFFLPKEPPPAAVPAPGAAALQPTIRVWQLRSLTGYYILDSVTPPAPWVRGSVNDYSWKTNVIAKVYEYQVSEDRRKETTRSDWLAGLGVKVELTAGERASSLQNITVAPAVLDHSNRPLEVSSYLFTFRSTVPTMVTGAIQSAANKPVLPGLKYDVTAGSPFTVRWSVTNHAEGWYTLTLDATLAGSPQTVVRFYHKRSLPAPK